jgi:hypothetical protein
MNQIELHKKIDDVLRNGPNSTDKNEVLSIILINDDAKRYFFFKADKKWINWLWDNGFLDVIKATPKDSNVYSFRTPEINYLSEIVKEDSDKITQIIISEETATTKDKFNPELIDRFLRMCDNLSPSQLSLVIKKIYEQKWVRLMSKFSNWGFEYEKMFNNLSTSKDYNSLLLLAEVVLDVRDTEDLKKTTFGFSTDNPFYFNDLSYTKVFEYLVNVPDNYTEKALELVTKTMTKIVLLGGNSEKEDVFPIQEAYYLYDVDFFNLNINQKSRLSSRDDVRELAAVIKILTDKLIGEHCDGNVIDIYNKYIKTLPKSRAMWRLHLYVLSLCPESFKEELKESFFKLFDNKVKNYTDIISGTEYEETLKRGFHVLLKEDKHDYATQVIEYFKNREEKDPEQKWHLKYGSDLLSMIIDSLDDEDKKHVEEAGFILNPNHKPEPSIIGPTMASTIVPQAPMSQEEFGSLLVDEISKKLRDDFSPKKLNEKYKGVDEFNRPHNAEGVGNMLQNDIKKRLQGYIDNANLFFERDILDQHYTYSFFRGVEEIIKNNRDIIIKTNWDGLIALFLEIKRSGEDSPFGEEKRDINSFDGWLSNWESVHSAMTDILQVLLREDNNKTAIDFNKYREKIFEILKYLLNQTDPTPEDEKIDTAKMTSGSNNEQQVSDPFSMAINSVRGRAFQALMFFIYPDGRNPKDVNMVSLKKDVKDLYEKVLNRENTKALMFMFGHYLPSFYFRDIEWMQGLLHKIFPKEIENKHLYIAAWEGYLANNLYKEIFINSSFQELYKYALSVEVEDRGRRYFKDPDDGIAIHLALAFVNYEEFDFNHPLFKAFWSKEDSELHSHFVSFIGRSYVSSDNIITPFNQKRIKEFWDWILLNCDEPETFAEFGLWINLNKKLFEPVWLADHLKKTFEKSNGDVDWDYNLTKSVVELSKIAPQDISSIARLHFLEGQVRHPKENFPLRVENEWIEAFKILYNNPETEEEIYNLIDDLIREGGGAFWILKDIIKEDK